MAKLVIKNFKLPAYVVNGIKRLLREKGVICRQTSRVQSSDFLYFTHP